MKNNCVIVETALKGLKEALKCGTIEHAKNAREVCKFPVVRFLLEV